VAAAPARVTGLGAGRAAGAGAAFGGAAGAAAPAHPAPGAALLHPAALLAVAVLVANDHVLKPRLGAEPALGLVTGKVSGVAGLVFFPLLLVALVELARWAAGRPRPCGRRGLRWAVAATGLGYAAAELVPPAAAAHAGALAALRWAPAGLAAALAGAPWPPVPEVAPVMDVTDILCLPALRWAHGLGLRTAGVAGADRSGDGGGQA
jgi:hypothetical protein